ncbi:acyl carrier protein [Duganella sp. FT27W]|uniref:acyl carrier protein n=1 Tax=Duganella sp. FT27W TaxID=2654636 RepID=UPI00128D29C5|nr:acyl carrier protein [Duganella sp. FT27W]MPQ56048.1 acyl carrier protein [Duganella sp. FT27W]
MNNLENQVCDVLRGTLGLGKMPLSADSPLLGALPQLDSMAVLALLTALEEYFGIAILDDEISARHFATVGTLTAFVQSKRP